MNILDRISETIVACEKVYDAEMFQADSMTKIANMQRECTRNSLDLAIMNEAADDELQQMMESGDEKFIQKIRAAAEKAKNALVAFFNKLISGIKDLQEKASEKIAKLKIRNPLVSNKRVKGPDKGTVKKAQKEYEKLRNDLNKLALRSAAGDDIRFDDVSECYEEFTRRMEIISSESEATVKELTEVAKSAASEANKALDDIAKNADSTMDELIMRARRVDGPDAVSVFNQIINTISRAAQRAGNVIAAFPGKVIGAVGSALGKGRSEQTHESVDEMDGIFDLSMDDLLC